MARAILLLIVVGALQSWGLEGLVWPTPNTAYLEGKDYAAYVQPTASGEVSSGLFGCTRSGGFQFHEGLDLFPLRRNSKGEATDAVFAVLPGKVVYTSNKSGYSAYGRYIVVEHREEGFVYQSLYAHLAAIAPGITEGVEVSAGQRIATMGRSASSGIPKDRAHLHLEFNVRISNDFQPWYARQKYSSPNRHGDFHGYNFIGWDPIGVYNQYRQGRMESMSAFVRALPTAVVAIVRTEKIPSYIRRNGALLTAPIPAEGVKGWQIEFTPEGLPKLWTPLTEAPRGRLRLVAGSSPQIPCRRLIASSSEAGRDLRPMLELLFGGKF
jgi:peptidoglycan LD-endopeptidase LytH